MFKKKKLGGKLYFGIFLILIIFLISLFYFGINEDLYTVKENQFTKNPIIKDGLRYKTHFCANKLSLLLEKIHFVEGELLGERNVLGQETLVKVEEGKLLSLKEKEIKKLKLNFDSYKKSCDNFDVKPTSKLCTNFLKDSQELISQWQKKADNSPFFDKIQIMVKELRRAKTARNELKKICNNLK